MSIVLNVVTAEGRQLPIHVAENDTLATIRSKVYSTHGFSLADRDLYFNAIRYSDTYDLATIGAAYNGAIMGASVPKTNLSVNVNATSFVPNNMHSPVSVSPQMNVPIMSSPLQQPFRRFSETTPTAQSSVMSVPLTPVAVTPTMLPLTLPNTPVLISPTSNMVAPEPRRFSDTATAPVFYRTSITQSMYPPYSPQSASTPTSATSLTTSSPSFHTTSTASPTSFHPMMMSSPSPTSTTSTTSTNTISPANSDKLQDKRPSFKRLQSNNPFEQVEATLELAESHPINETLYEKSKDSLPDAAIATPPTPESRFKLLRASTTPSNIQVNIGTIIPGPPSPAHQRTPSFNTTASPKIQEGHGLPPRGRHKKGLSVAFDLALTAYEHDKLASEAEITQLTSKLKELQSQSSEITKNHTDDVETLEEQVKKLRLELEKTVTERDLKMAKYKHDIGDLQNQYHTATNELQREQTRSKEILANAVQQQTDWEMKIQTVTATLIHTQEETRVEKVKHDEVMNALTSKYATLSCKRDTEHWEREQSQQKLMGAIYQVLSDHGLVNDVYKYMKYRDSLERETKETDITMIERNLTKKLQQTTVNTAV